MKKQFLIILTITTLITAVVSCKKIASSIFGGFDTTVDFQLSLPVVPIVSPFELPLGQFHYTFNLDSIVKAKTAGSFGAEDVTSIKVKEFNINITDADAQNNLANFQSVRVTIHSNTNNTPAELFAVTFPDTYATTFSTAGNNAELLSYLKGSNITYTMYGRNRRTTSKPLNVIISVIVRAS